MYWVGTRDGMAARMEQARPAPAVGIIVTLRLLPDIARTVGDQVEVLLDGGVRRGGAVVKALALGARAVMIGRAYLWVLGANGQAGVEDVLDLMRWDIDSCLLAFGHSSISELSPEDLVMPPGSTRRLGADADQGRMRRSASPGCL
jgi:isopentenyl diphosphate isomerase/L-lactate dehydrogenase-like FMN-dependent dehydrogenase